jgi:hypothetical protein
MTETTDRKAQTQAFMKITEVIQAANDNHASDQGLSLAGQGAGVADQAGKPLAEGGIEPLDQGGVDPTRSLGNPDQSLDQRLATLNDAPVDVQLSGTTLLDQLHDGNVRPGDQLRASFFTFTARQGGTKSGLESHHVTGQTIHSQQQGTAQGEVNPVFFKTFLQSRFSGVLPSSIRLHGPQEFPFGVKILAKYTRRGISDIENSTKTRKISISISREGGNMKGSRTFFQWIAWALGLFSAGLSVLFFFKGKSQRGLALWMPKLFAGAISPFLVLCGAAAALLGYLTRSPIAALLGGLGCFLSARYVRRVTAPNLNPKQLDPPPDHFL